MKNRLQPSNHTAPRVLLDMIEELQRKLQDSLKSIVLYGPAAREESYAHTEGFQLMLVLGQLDPFTMRSLQDPLRSWLRRGQPMPKFFSPALINDSVDVFPLEFLEIAENHLLLFGSDPFATLEVHRENLRLQCERDFRETMMRLREHYLESYGSERQIRLLLQESWPAFALIFRGCLRLLGSPVPLHDSEVMQEFCKQAEILHRPFADVEKLLTGPRPKQRADQLFDAYYTQLTLAVQSIDRFDVELKETEHE